jgi:hypothetical protein
MRKISPQELLRLVNSGADIELPEIPKDVTQVEGVDSIGEYLQVMAENQLKMVKSLDRLANVLAEKSIDLSPLIEAMTASPKNIVKQEGYDFKVKRLANGRIDGITAKVVEH